ncbi:hypothetical protein EC988_008138, partial [Linderina pennispora]
MSSVAEIQSSLLTREGGVTVSAGPAIVGSQAFVTQSPVIVSSNSSPHQRTSPAQRQGNGRATLMDLPITTHFCSSCKKRMPFDAFQRRQNGSLYNTCIS